MSFRQKASRIDALLKAAESMQGSGENNQRQTLPIWKPKQDKAGNAYAVVRFLPEPPDEDMPWVQYAEHGFKGPTGLWYIERCRTSIGERDPVEDWNINVRKTDKDKKSPARKQAYEQRAKVKYVANVLVIKDSSDPENEGKVFLYEFGITIFKKIMDAMKPEFEDETPIDPFDLIEGADFKIKVRDVDGWVNYEKSEFSTPSPLFGGDEEAIEKVYAQVHSLKQFIDPANYKSYEELAERFTKVLNGNTNYGFSVGEDIDDEPVAEPRAMREAPAPEPDRKMESFSPSSSDDDDDDDDMEYFKRLAQGS